MKRFFTGILAVVVLLTFCGGCDFQRQLEEWANSLPEDTAGGLTDSVEDPETEYIFDIEEENALYCYSALSGEQQRIYRILLNAAQNMKTGWIKLGRCAGSFETDVSVAYQAIANDFPEFFWLPNSYLISHKGSSKKPTVTVAFDHDGNEHSCHYLIKAAERQTMCNNLDRFVDAIVNETAFCRTAFQKELVIHDRICKMATYTEGEAEDLVYTAYGALVNGDAVCEGYARAMQLVCKTVGIPCILINGRVDETGHMWNLINIGSSWYHLDVTWDDQETVNHTYFNMTDEQIAVDHTVARSFTELKPEEIKQKTPFNLVTFPCDKTAFNYFYHEGLVVGKNYASVLAQKIAAAAEIGETHLQFRFSSADMQRDFEKNYQSYATDIQKELGKEIRITNVSTSVNVSTLYWKQKYRQKYY